LRFLLVMPPKPDVYSGNKPYLLSLAGCSKKAGKLGCCPQKTKLLFRLTRMGFGVSLAASPSVEFVA
jgi:hypothetical protein